MAIKISARDVLMDFPARDAQQRVSVLQGFDLDVREGEFLSVLGPSGCGKSTFLSILAGLTPRTGGRIHIDGQQLAGVNRRQGVVFQGYALFPWRTVLDNIAVAGSSVLDASPLAVRARQHGEHAALAGADRAQQLRFLAAHHVGDARSIARCDAGDDRQHVVRRANDAIGECGQ